MEGEKEVEEVLGKEKKEGKEVRKRTRVRSSRLDEEEEESSCLADKAVA